MLLAISPIRTALFLALPALVLATAEAQAARVPMAGGGVPPLPPPAACAPAWQPTFGSHAQSPGGDMVGSTCVFDDGNGAALYVGGWFTTGSSAPATAIARWDGTSWSPLGSGLQWSGYPSPVVNAIAVYDDGSGPAVYAGGIFDHSGSVPISSVAKWDGANWSALGSGISGEVWALKTHDDGTGPALYAAGWFATAGGIAAHSIARWNGNSWSTLGSGLLASGATCWVNALEEFDDGTGLALYAGGEFTTAGGQNAHFIAKWNGANWSAVGGGIFGSGLAPQVYSLATFGGELFVGGYFDSAGGNPVRNLVAWTGTGWHLTPNSMSGSYGYSIVLALHAHDDGSGPALYAGGNFLRVAGVPANGIARWDGSNWTALGGGLPWVRTLTSFDSGGGPSLIAGANFASAPDSGDTNLARWGNPLGCGSPGTSVCEPGSGSTLACPCANAPSGAGLGCDNSSLTGGAALAATGIARLAYDSVVFTTSGERPTATSVVLQGDVLGSGVVFGQGVRCVGGVLKRLYVKTASGGSIQAPAATDAHVHARAAALGDAIAPGTHRYYGVYYRDPVVLGGCAATSTFNITQQLDLVWSN